MAVSKKLVERVAAFLAWRTARSAPHTLLLLAAVVSLVPVAHAEKLRISVSGAVTSVESDDLGLFGSVTVGQTIAHASFGFEIDPSAYDSYWVAGPYEDHVGYEHDGSLDSYVQIDGVVGHWDLLSGRGVEYVNNMGHLSGIFIGAQLPGADPRFLAVSVSEIYPDGTHYYSHLFVELLPEAFANVPNANNFDELDSLEDLALVDYTKIRSFENGGFTYAEVSTRNLITDQNSYLVYGVESIAVVPEPSSIALAAVALVGLVALGRRRRA